MFLRTVDVFGLFSMAGAPQEDSNALPELDSETEVSAEEQLPAKVILFNDEVHTFEEVIGQIIKATGCDRARSAELTWEVHHSGKAMVFEGVLARCVQVSSILEEIELMTQIEM